MIRIFKKIFICILLVLTLCFVSSTGSFVYAKAMSYYNFDFSTISEEESIDFVEHHNIDIPDKIENSQNLGKITSDIIKMIASDNNCVFSYNYDKIQLYAENIQEAVISYMGDNSNIALLSTSTYSLQYNTVKNSSGNWVTSGGAWNTKWSNYNCYAYSINRIENPQYYFSGWYIQYQPGNMSGTGSFDDCNEITDLVEIIEYDLEAMGYSNISSTLSIPTVTDDEVLICVRMFEGDYHFMRFDLESNAWYHKPGGTAVLKYNYIPNNSMDWYCEYSYLGEEGYDSSTVYDSDIYFIKYDKNRVETSYSTSNLSYQLYVNAGKDSILEIDNSSYNQYFKFNITSSNSVETELYDSEMELLETYTGSNIIFYKSMLNDVYYLKLNYVSSTASGNVNIGISAHNHSYTYSPATSGHTATCADCGYTTTLSHVYDKHYCIHCNAYTTTHDYDMNYEWVSYTMHSAECCCGEVTTQGHAVASGSYNTGQRYATCLLCGGLAEMGFVQWTINSSAVTKVTINGSFILPNGVVVLEDEDLDAYLNGTLVFYDKDKVPVLQ